VLVFLELLDAARTILKDAPTVRDAVEDRLIEILIDEIGHVSFQRLSMGRTGLALTRALLPIVALGLSSAVPEVRALGAFPVRRSKHSRRSPGAACPRRCDETRSSPDHEGR
jgi:hypothetical protein